MTQIQLLNILSILFPGSMNSRDYTVAVDGNGNASISLWNNNLGAQPTSDQLAAQLATLQLQQAQAVQISTITASYQAARYSTPVSVTIGGASLSFPTDTDTQTNVMAYLAANVLQPGATTTYPLLDASNTLRQMSYTDLVTLAQAIQTASLAAFGKKQTLAAEIAAATTIAAVQAVVWS